MTPPLRAADQLVVDVVLDNLSDNYSSKPAHVSPEFNNVMACPDTLPDPLATRYRAAARTEGASLRDRRGRGPATGSEKRG
jgi:hypothetical protein